MGYKNNNRCLDRCDDDEPIFVLRAQDMLAPSLIRMWANLAPNLARLHGLSDQRYIEAESIADQMEDWPDRKFPD